MIAGLFCLPAPNSPTLSSPDNCKAFWDTLRNGFVLLAAMWSHACSITETTSHGQLARDMDDSSISDGTKRRFVGCPCDSQQSLGLLSTAYMTYQVLWKGCHSILPVTTHCIQGKIHCHAHLFRLHNGSQGLKSTWQWEHGFCTCGDILDARTSAAAGSFSCKKGPGISALQDQLEQVHHLTLCFLFLFSLQVGWEMPTVPGSLSSVGYTFPKDLLFPQLVFSRQGSHTGGSHLLQFVVLPGADSGRRRELHLLGQNLLAVSVHLG